MRRLSGLCGLLVLIGAACAPAAVVPTPATAPTPAITAASDATVDAAALAPDFTAAALDGTPYTLSALRGRWVLLNFWATWCAPCTAELPALQQIADTYADAVVVLGVNLRESAATVAPFVAAHKLRFPILIDPDDATLVSYQVIGLPQTLLIAPDGAIVYRQFGPVEFASFSVELAARLG